MAIGDDPGAPQQRRTNEPIEALQHQLSAARHELEQARRQLADYEALLEDLPGMFERKFQQRQQPFLLQHQLLARDNQSLREILKRAGRQIPPPPPPSVLQPAAPELAEPSDPTQPSPGQAPSGAGAMVARGVVITLGFIAIGAGLATMQRSLVRPSPAPAAPPVTASKPPSPPAAAKPVPAAPPKPPPNQLVLSSSGPNWVTVRTLGRQPVYEGMLKGEKTLPLGQGLEVLAGRPDLLTVRQGAGKPRVLGRISELTWFRFKPQAPPASNPAPKP